jgi:uncharacterized protein (DUF2267 family)
MEADDFIDLVSDELGTSPDASERAVRAVLETLGQRLPADEAEDLAAQLPPPLARCLEQTATQDEEFPVDEFYERVAELGDSDIEEAHGQTHAVLSVLDDAVSAGQITDLIGRLPSDYADLLAGMGSGPAR